MRIIFILLTLCVGTVLAGCERTEFEKKSQADADVKRASNLKRDESK